MPASKECFSLLIPAHKIAATWLIHLLTLSSSRIEEESWIKVMNKYLAPKKFEKRLNNKKFERENGKGGAKDEKCCRHIKLLNKTFCSYAHIPLHTFHPKSRANSKLQIYVLFLVLDLMMNTLEEKGFCYKLIML